MWRKFQKTLAKLVPLIVLLVYLGVAICLLNRWDSMVAVTLVPIWAWTGIGAFLSLAVWIACKSVPSLVMLCVCLATGIVFSEETHGIVREVSAALRSKGDGDSEMVASLRVVNVNCSGSEEALRRASDAKPDIMVIQQAPDESVLEAVADQLFGVERSVSMHGSNAIIARGELLGVLSDPESSTLHVRLKLPQGMIVDITNLELAGCAPSLSMWRPSVWKQLIESRIRDRRLVRASLGENEISKSNIGRIVSGGFGTPPRDDVYRPLEMSGLIETFAVSGIGWGNTFPSDYPLLRLDQIWVSPNLEPIKSTTRLNPESRSRAVVSDLRLPAK